MVVVEVLVLLVAQPHVKVAVVFAEMDVVISVNQGVEMPVLVAVIISASMNVIVDV